MRREVVQDDVNLLVGRTAAYDLLKKSTNSSLEWRGGLPATSPVRVFKAAYSDSVPWR
ncbi:MAG: hypothetical protein JO307_12810 [Bryobacterales bacterium]|nr:hypothetical protein [Bryobacterales bacterium]MBV9397738.1 hypothetical protein [Bryobacterales bacterium]